MHVITRRDSEDLNTQIVQGFGNASRDAAIVFTREDRAAQFLVDSDRADEETVAELPGGSKLAFLAKLADLAVDQLLVDPVWCSDDDTMKDFGVIELTPCVNRLLRTFDDELLQATILPVSGGDTFVYHCQNCGAIEHRSKEESTECCGHPMVLGARSTT